MSNEIISRAPNDCKFFPTCSSNLCSLDPDIKTKVWNPEENDFDEMCRNPEFASLQYVKTQKKISRLVRKHKGDRDDFFTFEMLNRDIVVKSGIHGIPEPIESIRDTTKWHFIKETRWISIHPKMKQLSDEEIERRRERMKSIRKVHSSIHFPETAKEKGAITSLDPDTSQISIDGRDSL
jgi:hypothetical protein